MKHLFTSLLIIASLVFGMTGCPKTPKTVREFREKSAELSTYGRRIITAIGEATLAGEISKGQLAALNPITGAFVRVFESLRLLVTSLRILFSQVHIEYGSPYKESSYGFA